MAISIQEFEKALKALDEALSEPESTIARDAAIQRFEFCIELAWKTAKKVMGTVSTAPKIVLREMAQAGLISDLNLWFDFLEARNLSSHTYDERIAKKVFEEVKKFPPHGQKLLKKLNQDK